MPRPLSIFWIILLVLAGVAAALLWARSDSTQDQLRVGTFRGRYWQINTYPGGVACTVATGWYENQPWEYTRTSSWVVYPRTLRGASIQLQRFDDDAPAVRWSPVTQNPYGPLMLERGTWGPAGIPPTMPYVTYDLRYWALTAAATLPLFVRIALSVHRARRRHRRLAAGQCATCGYDLTANQTGVCPECGANGSRVFAAATAPD